MRTIYLLLKYATILLWSSFVELPFSGRSPLRSSRQRCHLGRHLYTLVAIRTFLRGVEGAGPHRRCRHRHCSALPLKHFLTVSAPDQLAAGNGDPWTMPFYLPLVSSRSISPFYFSADHAAHRISHPFFPHAAVIRAVGHYCRTDSGLYRTAAAHCHRAMVDFFNNVPREIHEMAMIDGCSPIGAFLRVVLPNSLPGIVVAGSSA